jgi:hypothetical protein
MNASVMPTPSGSVSILVARSISAGNNGAKTLPAV